MTIWPGIGVNYGHSYSTGNYSTAQVEADLTLLKSAGVSNIRIAGPTFGGPMTANCQDMVIRALAHGFYVVWGVATGFDHLKLTATTWGNFKTYVTGTLAPWAQTNGLTELMIGNECDWEADGTTLLASTVQADIRTMASTVKTNGFTGIVSFDTAAAASGTMLADWSTGGLGVLDKIGWNSYDILSIFTSFASSIVSDFGSKAYISEFGCKKSGYPDYNLETLWYSDLSSRISILQSAGLSKGYFFTYRDGGFGLTPDTFALILANGDKRQAYYAFLGQTVPLIYSPVQV